MNTNVNDFIQQLKNDKPFRRQILPKLLRIEEGNWDKIVEIAAEFDYSFSVKELVDTIPEGFFKGKGSNPSFGWDEKTKENV